MPSLPHNVYFGKIRNVVAAVQYPQMSLSLSLTCSLAFSSLAWEYLRTMEQETGKQSALPLRPDMIKASNQPSLSCATPNSNRKEFATIESEAVIV